MKPTKFRLVVLNILMLTGISSAHAQAFSLSPQPVHSVFYGPYVGIKLGENWSNSSGAVSNSTHNTTFVGVMAGYGFDVNRFVLGVEGFSDFHGGSTTKDDGGVDVRFGIPLNRVLMPYARLGFTGTWPTTRLHGGLGVEYALYDNVHVSGEWTTDTSNSKETKRTNNSFTIGLTYYFR
jgi:outer membrane immunogenic protein